MFSIKGKYTPAYSYASKGPIYEKLAIRQIDGQKAICTVGASKFLASVTRS